MRVRDLMTRWPVTVTPTTSLMEARRLLRGRDIRHLPVVDGEAVVGMVSDRDLLLRDPKLAEALGQLHSDVVNGRYRHVGEVMAAPAITIAPDASVTSAAALLRRRGISALPVVERGRLVGIATTNDLLGALTEGQPAALPDAEPRVPLGPGDARPGRPAERLRALVVDPQPAARSRLAAELTAEGYEVWTCPGPCTPTRCPARDGPHSEPCSRLPADVALIVADQGSARTRLLDAYAHWAPKAHVRVTGTLATARPTPPPDPA